MKIINGLTVVLLLSLSSQTEAQTYFQPLDAVSQPAPLALAPTDQAIPAHDETAIELAEPTAAPAPAEDVPPIKESTLPTLAVPAAPAVNLETVGSYFVPNRDSTPAESDTTAQVKAPSLTQTGLVIATFLAGLGALGILLVRLRGRAPLRSSTKGERPLHIVQSLNLNPKRQIMLVSVRGQEILLTSTESGVSLLSELNRPQTPVAIAPAPSYLPAHTPQREHAREAPLRALPEAESPPKAAANTSRDKTEILRGALRNLREKRAIQEPEAKSTKIETNAQPPPTPATDTTAKKRGNAFPRYLAATFEEESRRQLNESEQASAANLSQAAPAEETVESITQMIRDRLRTMNGERA